MPSKAKPQVPVQKQKWCPARHHWVTVKPYSKVYLSSLKGSALTLGVSIDLGNTVPSAPEITKQNRRQIVNIISCYQGSDCQIIPRCNFNLTPFPHCLTPFLSHTHPFCPQEKLNPYHLKSVVSITIGNLPVSCTLDCKICVLNMGSVCWPSWCREHGTDTSLITNAATSLTNEPGCMSWNYFFCWALRDSQRKTKFWLNYYKHLSGQAVLLSFLHQVHERAMLCLFRKNVLSKFQF